MYMETREENSEFIKNSNVEIKTLPLGKSQDYINTGVGYDVNGERVYWILALDGHGTNRCIDFLKTYEWEEIILRENDIIKYINNQFVKFMKIGYVFSRSGSTFSLVKIYKDKIITTNVGDSQTAIFINNDLVYINEKHNLSNIKEKERVKNILYPNEPITCHLDHKIVGENILTYTMKEYYCNYINGLTITMTQSLGHNNFLDCFPDIKTINYNSDKDKVKVIIGTDGFWDMISLDTNEKFNDVSTLLKYDCESLIGKAVMRWNQTWEYEEIDHKNEKKRSYGYMSFTNIDDVSVGIYSNYEYSK